MDYIHYKKYQLSICDTDMQYRITPTAVLNFFQDIATEHAGILNVGRDTLSKDNAFWILSRISFEIKTPLKFTEKIKLKTWVATAKTAYTDRDYIIYNEAGEIALVGTSKWCIVDNNTRSLKKITSYFNENDIGKEERYIDSKKISIPDNKPDSQISYIVRPSDIDINRHMNNAKYADLVFNSFTMEEYDNKYITEFHINYLNEITCNNLINIKRWDLPEKVIIEGSSVVSEKALFLAEVKLDV